MALLVSPALMLQVLVLRLVLQNLEAFLLTPILLRRTVNLLPTVALMAQLSLGALLGLPGVLLALPLVVVLQVAWNWWSCARSWTAGLKRRIQHLTGNSAISSSSLRSQQ